MLQRTPATLLEPDRDAVAIGKLYRQGNQSIIAAARFHIQCGQQLTKKKQALGHGQWLPWLQANADLLGGLTPRTAQLLMQAAAKYEVDFAFADVAQAKEFNRQLWHNDISNAWVNSRCDEWFTCDQELDLVRTALGGSIDCDPASCAAAQLRVQAERFFTKIDDGLKQHWHGTVFLNPPYSRIAEFTDQPRKEYAAGRTTAAVLLTPASTSTRWFQQTSRSCNLLCLSNGRRIHFIDANGNAANPAQGSALFFFGHDLQRFHRTFSRVGAIWSPAQQS
jgi:hypothetical protein